MNSRKTRRNIRTRMKKSGEMNNGKRTIKTRMRTGRKKKKRTAGKKNYENQQENEKEYEEPE